MNELISTAEHSIWLRVRFGGALNDERDRRRERHQRRTIVAVTLAAVVRRNSALHCKNALEVRAECDRSPVAEFSLVGTVVGGEHSSACKDSELSCAGKARSGVLSGRGERHRR